MFTGLILWWKEQMRGLCPASFPSLGRTWQTTLVAVVEASDLAVVEMFLDSRSGRTSLGRYELNGTGLREAVALLPAVKRRASRLQVCPDLLLVRDLVLPLAAEQDLKRVVAYEMDRLTPFRADEVFWTCVAGQRDTARKQVHVRLTIVPRVRVQPILAALQQAGVVPTQIVADEALQPCQPILLGEAQPDRASLRSRCNAYSLAGCGVLAAAAVALPFILQAAAGSGIEAQIDAIKPQAMEAERLRNKIASGATATDAITAARGQSGTPLQAIALLTDLLPDDTFLTRLSVLNRKLTISGKSAAAARLIGAMTASPVIHDPAFTAPVIRDETNGGETFSIHAEIGT